MNVKQFLSKFWNIPSRWGEKLNLNWLIYNPGVFLEFAFVAKRNAPIFSKALITTFPNAHCICDLGAGTGHFVKSLNKSGKMSDGYEYSRVGRLFARLIGIKLISFDLNKQNVIPTRKSYDLVFSLEVGEHIPEELSVVFVDTLTSLAPIVVITCAGLGQVGHGHINCQPKSFWKNLFIDKGWAHDDSAYNILYSNLSSNKNISSFLLDNLMVFRKI